MKTVIQKTLCLGSTALAALLLTGCWTRPTLMPPPRAEGPTWLLVKLEKHHDATLQPMPAGTPAGPMDVHGRIMTVDRSYRLLRVIYQDGHWDEFKIELPETLDTAQRNDNVIVRAGPPLASGS